MNTFLILILALGLIWGVFALLAFAVCRAAGKAMPGIVDGEVVVMDGGSAEMGLGRSRTEERAPGHPPDGGHRLGGLIAVNPRFFIL